MMNEMAKLIATALSKTGTDFTTANYNIQARGKALLERLSVGTETNLLQGLSDTDATVEATTYLLWKALNG
jgi:hypothetical protein